MRIGPRFRKACLILAAVAAALAWRGVAAADRDGDGIDDALEDALLQRYAPLVLLHPSEPAMPASTDWVLARSDLEPAHGAVRIMAASILGLFTAPPAAAADPTARLHVRRAARAGSRDPRDWTTYGHAYRASDGGIYLQYWLFYAFNDGYGLFDHEGDWEHVTVKLDRRLRPEGANYARHFRSSPGPFFPWAALSREGDHPVVLPARGTHGSYASPGDAPFWDRVCETADPALAPAAGCTVWATWRAGTGGVVNVGERGAARVPFLDWPGVWGATGRLGMDSRTAPPRGPAFQPGWCSRAAPGACP